MNTAPVVPLRRSVRIATLHAAKEARTNGIVPPQVQTVTPTVAPTLAPTMESRKLRLVMLLHDMLRQAEHNAILNVAFKKKVLHITRIFEFIYYNNMLDVMNSKIFENSITQKLNEIAFTIESTELPYWLAAKFNKVSETLLKQINERKNK